MAKADRENGAPALAAQQVLVAEDIHAPAPCTMKVVDASGFLRYGLPGSANIVRSHRVPNMRPEPACEMPFATATAILLMAIIKASGLDVLAVSSSYVYWP